MGDTYYIAQERAMAPGISGKWPLVIPFGENGRLKKTSVPEIRALLRRRIGYKLEAYFQKNRFSKKHHLGLGDIRLTIGQQDEILRFIGG